MDFVGKVISLLFNMLSRLVIAFLLKSKCLLISWLQSRSAVILEPKKIKSVTVSIISPSICYEVIGPDALIFVFWMLSFKPSFLLSSFIFIKRLFRPPSQRWQRNRTGRPLSRPQIHQKIIWTLRKFHKTTYVHWQRAPGTHKDSPLSLKGDRTKYKR